MLFCITGCIGDSKGGLSTADIAGAGCASCLGGDGLAKFLGGDRWTGCSARMPGFCCGAFNVRPDSLIFSSAPYLACS